MVRTRENSASSRSLTIIAFVLAIAALYFGRSVFIPLALALVLSFLLTPFVNLLERMRLRRVPSVLAAMLLALAFLSLFAWGVAGQLVQIMADLPDYRENLDAKVESLHATGNGNLGKATASVQQLNKELAAVPNQIATRNGANPTSRNTRPVQVQVTPPSSNFVQELAELLGPLSGPIEIAVIVVIFTMFILVKREDLRNRAIRLAGRGQLSQMTQAFDEASSRLSRYLLLQCLVNAGYGLLFGLGLFAIGVPHPLLWGCVAAVFRFIPYVGTLGAAVLPIAMAIAVFPGWKQAGIAFAVFVVLELVVANLVEPLLYGSHTGISSIAILVAAVFWATLWGPVGLILSTPLTVCLVVLGRYFPQLNFLEVVLGDEPALPPEQLFYQRLLALDQEEARSIAEKYLKENDTQKLYESIILPALKMAEQDHYVDALDDDTRDFVQRSVTEMIEDVGDRLTEIMPQSEAEVDGSDRKAPYVIGAPRAVISCVPARTGSDELATIMLAQLLRNAGYRAMEVNAGAVEEIAKEPSPGGSSIICVSCLPPFAPSGVRSLCKRLAAAFPQRQMIIALWHLDGGVDAGRERLGASCGGIILTQLTDVIAEIEKLASGETAPIGATEKQSA